MTTMCGLNKHEEKRRYNRKQKRTRATSLLEMNAVLFSLFCGSARDRLEKYFHKHKVNTLDLVNFCTIFHLL